MIAPIYNVLMPLVYVPVTLQERCAPILKEVAELINSKSPIIQGHPLLSILKLADVHEEKIPKSSTGHRLVAAAGSVLLVPILLAGIYSLYFCRCVDAAAALQLGWPTMAGAGTSSQGRCWREVMHTAASKQRCHVAHMSNNNLNMSTVSRL